MSRDVRNSLTETPSRRSVLGSLGASVGSVVGLGVVAGDADETPRDEYAVDVEFQPSFGSLSVREVRHPTEGLAPVLFVERTEDVLPSDALDPYLVLTYYDTPVDAARMDGVSEEEFDLGSLAADARIPQIAGEYVVGYSALNIEKTYVAPVSVERHSTEE